MSCARKKLLFVSLPALLIGCNNEGSMLGGGGPEVEEHMKDHYASAVEYRDWVIADDVDRARPPAVWLSDHLEPHDLPVPWVMFTTDLRIVAAAAAEARDLVSAAEALTALARTCARCHEANGVKIALAPRPDTPFTDDVGKVMFQHQWAANRMWEGLFMPSDAAWKEGCEEMSRAVLRPADVANLGDLDAETKRLEDELHRIAREGAANGDALRRSALYAEMVTSCAACHRAFAAK